MSGQPKEPSRLSRRALLRGAAALGGVLAAEPLVPAAPKRQSRKTKSPSEARLDDALEVRVRAAKLARNLGPSSSVANGDEERHPGKVACHTKALPHDKLGRVDLKSYDVLLRALASGRHEDFEVVPLGGFVKLANPQAAWSFDLIGPDSSQLGCPPAPLYAGAEQGGELVELYWQALARDIPFAEYGSHPLIARAAEDLSRMGEFRGPRTERRVSPATLFRGPSAGDLVGPYLSQFLFKLIPYLPLKVEQKIRTAVPAVDYMTKTDDWLAIQNGALSGVNQFDDKLRFLRNGRDLGEYVHRDFSYQAFLGAALIALKAGTQPDGGNPYKHSRTQGAFTTFGQPYLLYLLAVVTQLALKVCWYQKWRVHRRLRPEELAGRVEHHLSGVNPQPLHSDLLGSPVLAAVRARHGSTLLPQAYPEGCPTHPSYPAGHAVISGACVTALKACLDESHVLPEPVEASADGLSLVPWKGADLTVGGELDKLAANIAIGRNFAGIHWRSDGVEGLRLGEAIAIQALRELRLTGNELFSGFSLRRFDGSRITV